MARLFIMLFATFGSTSLTSMTVPQAQHVLFTVGTFGITGIMVVALATMVLTYKFTK